MKCSDCTLAVHHMGKSYPFMANNLEDIIRANAVFCDLCCFLQLLAYLFASLLKEFALVLNWF